MWGRVEGEVRRAVEMVCGGILCCSCEKMFQLCSLEPDACSSVREMGGWGVRSETVLIKLSRCLSVSWKNKTKSSLT